MSPVIPFCLVLLVSFLVTALLLRPVKSEKDVRRHLTMIEQLYAAPAAGSTILKQDALSSIPWLDDILKGVPGCRRLRLLISQAGSRWGVASVLLGSLVLAVVATWAGTSLIPSLPLALTIGLAAGLLPYSYLRFMRNARLKRFDTLLPEAIDFMSRALRAGHAINSVIEMVAQEIAEPVASEFRVVFEEQTLGLPMREAILNLGQRVPLDDVRFLATAILVQKETGGNLAEILDKTAAVMRERIRLKGQLRVYTAQGRITGWFLCSLPFIIFIVINLVNHDYEKVLLSDPLGLRLVYAGLVMMVLGILVIRKIIDIKV